MGSLFSTLYAVSLHAAMLFRGESENITHRWQVCYGHDAYAAFVIVKCVCMCVCVCVAYVFVFVCLRFCVFEMITASSVLRGSFYQMRGIKCLKVRDLEAWGITERLKWPRDLPGFEPGTFRLPGACNPVGFKLHSPRMTCSSVGNSPGKWEEYCALPLALITVQRLSISLDVSCWQWGCWRWSPVRSGFESSCPTLSWKSKHGTEKRPISCATSSNHDGAPWLRHFPRTLQAGLNKLLSEDKPPLETSADFFQKSKLLDSCRLDFRRVRSHFSLRARNHPVHQHVDWALFVRVPSSGGLLIANGTPLRSHTLSGFSWLLRWTMSWFESLARCMFDNAERKKRCSSVAVLVHVDFFSFLFMIALWPARFVTNEHVQASGQESIVRSSPLIESLKKMKCPDTSGDRYLWTLKHSASTVSEKDERLVAADMDGAPLRLPNSALSEYCQRWQERRERQPTILVEL